MILKTTWIPVSTRSHPELNNLQMNEKLLALSFIQDSSIDALQQKALKMRSLEIFQEPYDPPEYLN